MIQIVNMKPMLLELTGASMLMCYAVHGSPTTFSIVNGCYSNFMQFWGSLVSPLMDLSERVKSESEAVMQFS
jgi:hypothetical protein